MLPDVPAMAEFLPGYEAFGWIGFGAPKDTPAPIIETLNKADQCGRGRSRNQGEAPRPRRANHAAELGRRMSRKFIAADTEKWIKVAKFANIKVE